jgi:hypothetical protein
MNEHNEQKLGYDSLNPEYHKAIDLRLNGYTHSTIAKILSNAGYKVKEHTVRVWFMNGGKCYGAFNEIREIRMRDVTEILDEKEILIKQLTLSSLVILNRVLDEALLKDNFTPLTIRVAQDMLDRGGFPKQTKIESNAMIDFARQESLNDLSRNIRNILSSVKA